MFKTRHTLARMQPTLTWGVGSSVTGKLSPNMAVSLILNVFGSKTLNAITNFLQHYSATCSWINPLIYIAKTNILLTPKIYNNISLTYQILTLQTQHNLWLTWMKLFKNINIVLLFSDVFLLVSFNHNPYSTALLNTMQPRFLTRGQSTRNTLQK